MTAAHFLPPSPRQTLERDLVIGAHRDGSPALLPGSVRNVLVHGPRGADVSELADVLVGRWLERDVHVLVVAVAGRQPNLVGCDDVIVVEGAYPTGQALTTLFRRVRVVVLDLSRVDVDVARAQLGRLPSVVTWVRRSSRMQLAVVLDEAHLLLGSGGALVGAFGVADSGYAFATDRPDRLEWAAVPQVDVVLTARGPGHDGKRREPLMTCQGGPSVPFGPVRHPGTLDVSPPSAWR